MFQFKEEEKVKIKNNVYYQTYVISSDHVFMPVITNLNLERARSTILLFTLTL